MADVDILYFQNV